MSIPLSGNLKDTHLSEVLQTLRSEKASGTLAVRVKGVEKSIYVKGGQIVSASSTGDDDRLGETLIKAGTITREHLDLALDIHKKSGGFKKLGAILVENRFLSPKELFAGLKVQVKDIIYSLFLLDDAEYRFDENLPAEVIQLQIDIEELIKEIIEKIRQGV